MVCEIDGLGVSRRGIYHLGADPWATMSLLLMASRPEGPLLRGVLGIVGDEMERVKC